MAIIGGILAVLALLVSFGIQNQVRKDTGVWVTRSNLRYIRRQARLKGIPEAQAYDDWMSRKQKRLGVEGVGVEAQEPATPPRSKRGCIVAVLFCIVAFASFIGWAVNQSPAAPRTAVVDRTRINCRQSASETSAIVQKLDRGASVEIASEEAGWSKLGEPSCWVRSDLLKAN